ncbi:putative RDD family membrane protein YckC [Neisseria sp. HSC-16F19]|nr:RDD family protein [Neisseria sp. HSC-16F19]MCP2041083.1 putative RDD family membrane protein YckC [Neisseria sp. HSC-16F19]
MSETRPQPASLKRRLAALVYESLLVGAVTVVAALLGGIVATVLQAVPFLGTLAVSLLLLAAWWGYFWINWRRQGQTLPMRVWRIGLTDRHGRLPPKKQLQLRFAWACVFVVLIPALAYWALRHNGIPPKTATAAALIWWILPWGFALMNPQRQFLYDYLAGTQLVEKEAEKKK